MKNLILGFIVLFALSAYSQSIHTIDFEPLGLGADWEWSMQENGTNPPLEFIANPVSGGINTSATVAKFTATQAGNPWALVFTDDDGQFTFDASNCIVKIMVYKEVLTNIGIKFEGFSTPVELQVANTLINQWEEITFDFTASIGNTYSRLVVIPDFEARTEDHIIYFDNIQLPDGVPMGPLPEPTTVPPTPPQAAANVLSIYSEAYTNLAGTNFNPNWGQATTVTVDYLAAGNKTLRYENLNYQGTEFSNQDVSGYEYIHIDFWTPNSTLLNFYLIGAGGEKAYALPITAETWVSLDIPLSSFVPPVNLTDVFQFKVDGNGTVYFDNWYFWKNPTNPEADASLSDLLVDGTTVEGFSSSTLNYALQLPFGTSEVPEVTAVTTVEDATFVINDAVALPGTTQVVVTSQDETNTMTYSIAFTVAPENPLSEYCETEVWHFNDPAELASAIYLTISNINANSMIVEIESATDDPVDFLLVLGASGAQISEQNTSVPGKISRTLSWADAPPADVLLNVLWSKLTFPGNWMLSQGDFTVPFDAGCSGVAGYLSFNPQDGAVAVPVDITPTLTFSVPVEMADGSQVTNADIPSLLVFNLDNAGGDAVAYSASINTAKTVITIAPDSELELGQDYYLALNHQVLRYQEGDLVSAQNATFSTPAAPKPYLAIDVRDNFENNGWATIDNWMFQDSPDLVDLTITADPLNPANHVADYSRTGTFLYTNAQCILDHRMNLSERNVFKIELYFPSSNDYTGELSATAAIKLQNSLLGGLAYTTQTEVLHTITQFDQWVVLEFDFELAADSLNYDQIVVQLGGENHLVPALFYFDNLELLKKGPKADFSATPVNGFAPLTVQFTDESDFTTTRWKWDFNNDGIIDATVKNPEYTYTTPGTYSVKLIASNPFIGSDEIVKLDYITTLEPPMQHIVDLSTGWSGISSYVIPEDASIETIFGSIAGNIEIMLGDNGMYYPSQGINTIVDWDSQSGYVLKMINNAQVSFAGSQAAQGNLTIAVGWSLVPVLSSCDVNIQDLLGEFDQLVMIKELAGTGIYWPAKGINTLPTLIPGKAYYFLTDEEISFTYPSCTGDALIWSDEFDEGEVNINN